MIKTISHIVNFVSYENDQIIFKLLASIVLYICRKAQIINS